MVIFILLFIVLLGVAGYIIWNLMRKLETYEDFITAMQTRLITTLAVIKDIDLRGAFEADDEVGTAFQDIKDAILRIQDFLGPDIMSTEQRSIRDKKNQTGT